MVTTTTTPDPGESNGPVFLLSCGGRSGSTLVQRLIASGGHILMWGEHAGIAAPLAQGLARYAEWIRATAGDQQIGPFLRTPGHTWIGNLGPPAQRLADGCRALMETWLAQPAREAGFPRWGFKEIRYGRAEIAFLHRLYPDARFVLLVRDPRDALRSIKGAAWYGQDHHGAASHFLNEWSRLANDFVTAAERPDTLLIRYEALVAQPDAGVDALERHLGVPARSLDRSVFATRARGGTKEPQPLERRDILALEAPATVAAARRIGYAL